MKGGDKMKIRRLLAVLATVCAMAAGLLPFGAAAEESMPAEAGENSTIEFDCGIDTNGFGPWMYDYFDDTPYVHDIIPSDKGVYAYASIVWNTFPFGDGSCGSVEGSGFPSFGDCTAENTLILEGSAGVTMEFSGLGLSGYQKINWQQLGQSYDRRNYTGGSGVIKVNGVPKLVITNLRITMDVHWDPPVGNGAGISGSGWGTIDPVNSDPAWVAEFDNGNGQIEYIFDSFSPVIQGCWGYFTTHITVQGAPHVEGINQLPVLQPGILDFPDAHITLDVHSFTNGGPAGDQNLFFANQIFSDPGGVPPAGIEQVMPDCFWELSTVLDAIDTDVIFILDGLAGLPPPEFLCILQRENADSPWLALPTLPFGNGIRTNNLTSFGEFAIGAVETCTLTITINGSGTVAPDAGVHVVLPGAVVQLEASPSQGHVFVNWTGDISTVDNASSPITSITMDVNKAITANFAPSGSLPGDVDGNGVVNVLDITAAARIILEFDPPVPGADVNQDGNVDIFDMTKIARLILGLE